MFTWNIIDTVKYINMKLFDTSRYLTKDWKRCHCVAATKVYRNTEMWANIRKQLKIPSFRCRPLRSLRPIWMFSSVMMLLKLSFVTIYVLQYHVGWLWGADRTDCFAPFRSAKCCLSSFLFHVSYFSRSCPFIIPYRNVKSAYVFGAFGVNFHYSCYPAAKRGQFWMSCGLNIIHSMNFMTKYTEQFESSMLL
jgi:hypothetical protein